MHITNAFAFYLIALPLSAHAATYYVRTDGNDNNSGLANSSSGAWKTLTKAAGISVAGDTVRIQDGNYTEPPMVFSNSGVAGSPITFMAEHPLQAIIATTGSGNQEAFYVNASYLIFDGLHVIKDPNTNVPPPNSGFYVFRFNPLTFPHAPSQPGSIPGTGYTNTILRNCQVDANPNFHGSVKTWQDYVLIDNCTFADEVEIFNSYGTIVRNSRILGSGLYQLAFVSKGGSRNIQFYNNIVSISDGGNGVMLGGHGNYFDANNNPIPQIFDYDPDNGIRCYNCVAYNNVAINSAPLDLSSPYLPLSLYMAGCQDCWMINNVVINGAMSLDWAQSHDATGATFYALNPNPTVYNNIVYGAGTFCQKDGWGSQFDPSRYTGVLTLDYNDFYNCTGAPSQPHPMALDPKFVAPSTNWQSADWYLRAGSPAIGAGITVASIPGYTDTNWPQNDITVNLDAAGAPRTAPWDLGIYAHAGAPLANLSPAKPNGLMLR